MCVCVSLQNMCVSSRGDACYFHLLPSPPCLAPFFLVFPSTASSLCPPPPHLYLPPLPHLRTPPPLLLLRRPLSVALLFIAMSSQGSAATKAFSCCHYNYSLHTCACTHAHTHTSTHARTRQNTRTHGGEEQQHSVCMCVRALHVLLYTKG